MTWDDYKDNVKSLSDEDRENMELIEKLAEIATRHLKDKGE